MKNLEEVSYSKLHNSNIHAFMMKQDTRLLFFVVVVFTVYFAT